MIYTVLSAVCIAVLLSITTLYVLMIKRDRIGFIDKFKKGSCVIIYLVAVPLYWMGEIFAGERVAFAFFDSIKKVLGLIVLDYDISTVTDLLDTDTVYAIALYLTFALATVNVAMLALSIFVRKASEIYVRKSFAKLKGERLIIVGDNDDSRKIYLSAKDREAVILDEINDEAKKDLYNKRIKYISLPSKGKGDEGENISVKNARTINSYSCELLKDALEYKKPCMMVINTGDNEKNITLCRKINASISKYYEERKDENGNTAEESRSDLNALKSVRVYVFGAPEYEAVYDKLVENSHGCIRYVNRYRSIAMDFVDRYPLTQFMTEEQLDYSTSTLKEGIEVNVALIGFGKTNQQLFLTSVANNQLLKMNKNGEPELEQVNYYFFEKEEKISNKKNLNHSYYRYENEVGDDIASGADKGENARYLPFPPYPANVEKEHNKLDINDSEFYIKLKRILSGEGAFNYVVISFGSDLENIDLACKIVEKKKEWGLKNTYIFVRVRSGDSSCKVFDSGNSCYLFGDTDRIVYNAEAIDDNVIVEMAKMRNRIYVLEDELVEGKIGNTKEEAQSVYDRADRKWYKRLEQFRRESNIYCCLSLRSKLHMMGLDYRKRTEGSDTGLDNDTYLAIYAGEDKLNYHKGAQVDGKKAVKYTLDFPKSRRRTMAIHEHYRWNSFMITKGFVPATIKEITENKDDHGRDYSIRRHGNLTTFDGLVRFRELISASYDEELKNDVIKYDYQLLDDAHWLLNQNGYEIIKKQ